jgi:hypothetical protein
VCNFFEEGRKAPRLRPIATVGTIKTKIKGQRIDAKGWKNTTEEHNRGDTHIHHRQRSLLKI